MKMKKMLTMLVAVTMGAMSLVGCGSKAPADATQEEIPVTSKDEVKTEAEEGVTLRMAWWGSQKRHDGTIEVIEMYEKLTGVKIEYEFYDFDNYFTKLNTLVSANDVWDVFQLGGNFPT